MLPSTSKNKLYLYLIFFIFLTSIFNFQLLKNYQNKFLLKKINIYGLNSNEKKMLEIELNILKNINIFRLSEEKVLKILNKYNFLENIQVTKIIPSTIDINLSKTLILGKTLINEKIFYIGKNGKFISSNQFFEEKEIASIYGNFKINEFLNLQKILNNQDVDVSDIEEFYYYKNKRWDLVFSNGQILMLPSKNIKKSIEFYKKFSQQEDIANIKIIDLRVTNQIILNKNNE